MMISYGFRYCVALLLLSAVYSSFILRIRTVDGLIHRLDVDEETKTIKQCYRKLIEAGKITEDAKLKIKDMEYEASSETTLTSLSLANGEIITVVDSISKATVSSNSNKTISKDVNTTSIKQSFKTGMKKVVSSASKPTKKKIVSIASMSAQKQSLEKITRQKSSTVSQSVIVMPSTERIFARIATGGVALLLGRTLQYKPTFKSKKSASSASASSAPESATTERNLTVVYSAYELLRSEDKVDTAGGLPHDAVSYAVDIGGQKSRVADVRALAQSMGLQIVGCCIGHPHAQNSSTGTKMAVKKTIKGPKGKKGEDAGSDNDSSGDSWHADHVHGCVQVRALLESHLSDVDQELFVTLR